MTAASVHGTLRFPPIDEMLKFAVLACFVAVCYAQTPPTRPMIPDDFMAKVSLRLDHLAEMSCIKLMYFPSG